MMKPDMYPDFIESCRVIGEIGCLKPGEKVCIMGDRRIEADVIYALIATAKMFGCDPYVCLVDEFEEWHVPDTIAPAAQRWLPPISQTLRTTPEISMPAI